MCCRLLGVYPTSKCSRAWRNMEGVLGNRFASSSRQLPAWQGAPPSHGCTGLPARRQLIPPGEAHLCLRRQEEGLDTVDPHAGCWNQEGKERKMQPSSHTGTKLEGEDSPSQALDGQEMIAPWKVDVKQWHVEAHTDHNEAFGKHCSKLFYWHYLALCVCELRQIQSVPSVYVPCVFYPYAHLFTVNWSETHSKYWRTEVTKEQPFP